MPRESCITSKVTDTEIVKEITEEGKDYDESSDCTPCCDEWQEKLKKHNDKRAKLNCDIEKWKMEEQQSDYQGRKNSNIKEEIQKKKEDGRHLPIKQAPIVIYEKGNVIALDDCIY